MRVPWKVPVIQAPIGPATTPELVSAVSGTGALGVLAASWTKPETLRRQLRAIHAAAGVDYCVNLVLAFDQEERLEVVLEEGVRYVSSSWGIDGELIERARKRCAVVLVQVGDIASAVDAAECGAELGSLAERAFYRAARANLLTHRTRSGIMAGMGVRAAGFLPTCGSVWLQRGRNISLPLWHAPLPRQLLLLAPAG